MQPCGTGKDKAGRAAGSSSSIWTVTKSGNSGSTTTLGWSNEKVDCSKLMVHYEIKLREN